MFYIKINKTQFYFQFGCLFQFRMYLMDWSLPKFKEEDNPASFSPHLQTRLLTYFHLIAFNLKLLISPTVLCYDWQIGSIPLVESLTDLRNVETLLMVCIFGVLFVNLLKWFLSDEQEEKVFNKLLC
jgi:Domain of unknown function (DUF1736).